MKPNQLFLLTSMILVVFLPIGVSQDIDHQFRHLTTEEGLGHTDATCLAQDTSGFIWIGTYFGLNRFDGYEIKSYFNEDETINKAFLNRINSICINANNNIWLATQGGVQNFDISTECFLELSYPEAEHYNLNREVNNIHYSPNGYLLVGRKRGISFYKVEKDGLTLEPIHIPKGPDLSNIAIHKIKRDLEGNFWLASSSGVYFVTRDLTAVRKINITDQEGKDYVYILDIFFNGEKLWLTAEKGLLEANIGKMDGQNQRLPVTFIDIDGLLSKKNTSEEEAEENFYVTTIVDDKKGSIWIGTTNGLIQYQPNKENSTKGAYP